MSCRNAAVEKTLTIQHSIEITDVTFSSPPNFQWNSQVLTEFLPNRTHKVTPPPVPLPRHSPLHSSQRSPPGPFWAVRISCAKLLICLVTSQCFLHGTEGKISTLLCAVNHSAPPLIHWYGHYSIRLHSNWPQFLVIMVGGYIFLFFLILFRTWFQDLIPIKG